MSQRRVFGVFIVVLGVLLMLDKFGIYEINLSLILSNWPLIIVFVGLTSIFSNSSSMLGGVITLIIGVLIQLSVLGYFNIFDFLYLWPVLLIFMGVWIMFTKGDGTNKDSRETINSVAIFSNANIRNFSQNFKGGSAVAVFGGVDIDFRDAEIMMGKEVTLDVVSVFGGVDIIVPREWNVVIKGVPIFGGWSNKTSVNKGMEGPILKINCVVVFGGMEVNN